MKAKTLTATIEAAAAHQRLPREDVAAAFCITRSFRPFGICGRWLLRRAIAAFSPLS